MANRAQGFRCPEANAGAVVRRGSLARARLRFALLAELRGTRARLLRRGLTCTEGRVRSGIDARGRIRQFAERLRTGIDRGLLGSFRGIDRLRERFLCRSKAAEGILLRSASCLAIAFRQLGRGSLRLSSGLAESLRGVGGGVRVGRCATAAAAASSSAFFFWMTSPAKPSFKFWFSLPKPLSKMP